jgi:hypothetical protein
MNSWAVTLPTSALLCVAALVMLGKFRRQIVFQL